MAPTKEVPRFSKAGRAQRARQQARRGGRDVMPSSMSGRDAQKFAATMGQAVAREQARIAAGEVPEARRGGLYRHRWQLVPFTWTAAVLVLGMSAHHVHSLLIGIASGLLACGVTALFVRHIKNPPTLTSAAMTFQALLFPPMLAVDGFTGWTRATVLTGALGVIWPWLRHYKASPEPVRRDPEPSAPPADYAKWETLAGRAGWAATLGPRENIRNGRRYAIRCEGSRTTISDIMTHPKRIAGTWDRSVTDAFAEPSPDGVESKGYLTILNPGSLAPVREWDGKGIDPATGQSVIGRYANGEPVHFSFYTPMDGVTHSLICGTTGSGKTELISLLLCQAAVSGNIIPVILDPQEGQSLPEWDEHVRYYAPGTPACMVMLEALYEYMATMSAKLAKTPWTDEDGDHHPGMGFFDHKLSGLPSLLVLIEEAPRLLKHPKFGKRAIFIIGEIGKLGRKAAVSEVLVAQVPSLGELQDQALRDMLVGGNAVCLRTANRVAAPMVNMEADPAALPKFFPAAAGEAPVKTYGLGYASGPDNCMAPARMMIERKPGRVARENPFREDWLLTSAIARAQAQHGAAYGAQATPAATAAAPHPPVALAPVPAAADDAQPGRTAVDAVREVIGAKDISRAEVILAAARLAKEDWGRDKPFSTKAIQDALGSLATEGVIDKTGHGQYRKRALRPVS